MFFIRNSIIYSFLCILSVSVASANEFGCAVDYKKFESFIDGSSKDIKVILPPKLHKPSRTDGEVEAGYIEHHVKLKDGIVVQFERGGCKRYGYQMRFENVKDLLERGSGDIGSIMKKVNSVVESVPLKDKKAFAKDWAKIRNYVENRKTRQFYEFDEKRGYIVTGAYVDKTCPINSKSICGVIVGEDVFEIYNLYIP